MLGFQQLLNLTHGDPPFVLTGPKAAAYAPDVVGDLLIPQGAGIVFVDTPVVTP